jgi:hypothetical protein
MRNPLGLAHLFGDINLLAILQQMDAVQKGASR